MYWISLKTISVNENDICEYRSNKETFIFLKKINLDF